MPRPDLLVTECNVGWVPGVEFRDDRGCLPTVLHRRQLLRRLTELTVEPGAAQAMDADADAGRLTQRVDKRIDLLPAGVHQEARVRKRGDLHVYKPPLGRGAGRRRA